MIRKNSLSYSSLIVPPSTQINQIQILDSSSEEKQIVKMIQKSEIFEDDLIAAIDGNIDEDQRKTMLDRVSNSQSFLSGSSTTSHVFQERRYLK